ncbi:MAG: phosphopantothenoylcysteine decarboxylase [Gemmataceae bacterium]|nr:phosphopantothenoylcysteine decarboxylase [Gemmataceae bacterium]
MPNILLGATGSVAAIKVPALFDALRAQGHAVRIVATKAATYFFDPEPLRAHLVLDEDEWPGERWERGDPVLHIELRRWADVLLIAPLDANTLAKLALGLCDNCLACVWRAWDRAKPVLLAPAMNTLMWEHPATARHLAQVAEDAPGVRIIPPESRLLACGDEGTGAMAGLDAIAATVAEVLGGDSGKI